MKTEAPNTYHVNERNNYIIEAKSLDFLNAVFCIYFYNKDVKRWGDTRKMPDISPSDVFNRYDKKEYDSAIEQCIELLQSSLEYGDQALTAVRYKKSEEYVNICKSFQIDNPSFNEKNLERALNSGMRAMR